MPSKFDIFGTAPWERYSCTEAPPPFSIVMITDGELDGPEWVNTVVKPDTTFRRTFGITSPFQVDLNGSTARGILRADYGPFVVAYDSGTPAADEVWGWKPGQWTASKGFPGLRVREIVDSTNKLMLAVREEPEWWLCKPDSNISKGSSGTVSVYNGADPPVDTTINVTAKALFDAVTSGKWCSLTFYGGVARVGKLEC